MVAKQSSAAIIKNLQETATAKEQELSAARANNDRLERELAAAKEESLALRNIRYRTLDGIKIWSSALDNADFADVCAALVTNHHNYVQLVASKRAEAKRIVEAADKLKASLRFIAKCTTGQIGATYVGAGKAMAITIDEILKQVCYEIDSLISSNRGVVDGRQDSGMVDYVAKLVESKAEKEAGK